MRRLRLRRSGGSVLGLLLALLVGACGFQEPALQPITREPLSRIEIPPIHNRTASMDVMVIDPATRTLYVADATDPAKQGIDIIDISTSPGRYLRTISTGDSFPNGLVIAPDVQRLYAANDDST
ncbi:MAG: YncE family protein, partial [Candidatus Dormibacteria bacterium]